MTEWRILESEPPTPRYPIGSVDRVLQLLLLFRDRRSIRVADAAAELGVASSTAHRLLAMLALHGFVTQDLRTRHYVCGPAVIELSHAVQGNEDITPLLQAATEDIAAAAGETANACVLRHTSVIFVAGQECDHQLRIADQTGRRMVAFHSAPGKVLLAGLSLERLRELYPSDYIEDPINASRISRKALEAELEDVRANGYATNTVPAGTDPLDFESVAVAVLRQTKPVAALAVAAPAQRVTPRWDKQMSRILRAAADSVEAKLD